MCKKGRRALTIVALLAASFPVSSRAGAPDGVSLTIHRGTRNVGPQNAGSWGNLVVGPRQYLEQYFVAVTTGTLIGIEIAPLRDTAEVGDTMELELFDVTGGSVLGIVALDAGAFPPGAGNVPQGLQASDDGPGYFDVSALHVSVTAGQQLSFALRPGFGPGVCDAGSFQCSAGTVGRSCSSDSDCDKAMRAGSSPDAVYPEGTVLVNGAYPFPGFDLAFKVVTLAPPDDAVSLSWTPRGQSYDLFRSEDPQQIFDPASLVQVVAGAAFVDSPPPAMLWCYDVRTRAQLDAYLLDSRGTSPVGFDEVPGQTFRIGNSGRLSGIEIAPLNDGSMAGGTLVLDVLDGNATVLGSAEIPTDPFPTGFVPAPLEYDTLGSGYFDLSSLGLEVSPGQELAFRLRPGWGAGACDLATHLCTSGRVGEVCFTASGCERYLEVGSGVGYDEGNATQNGVDVPDLDLAFKVLVLP